MNGTNLTSHLSFIHLQKHFGALCLYFYLICRVFQPTRPTSLWSEMYFKNVINTLTQNISAKQLKQLNSWCAMLSICGFKEHEEETPSVKNTGVGAVTLVKAAFTPLSPLGRERPQLIQWWQSSSRSHRWPGPSQGSQHLKEQSWDKNWTFCQRHTSSLNICMYMCTMKPPVKWIRYFHFLVHHWGEGKPSVWGFCSFPSPHNGQFWHGAIWQRVQSQREGQSSSILGVDVPTVTRNRPQVIRNTSFGIYPCWTAMIQGYL